MKSRQNISATNYRMFLYFGALFILAFVFRFWDLDQRAMHHDESLHALYSWYIDASEGFFGNGYKHDPMMHGPLQIELTGLIFKIFGDNEYTARILYVLCGSFIVVIPYFLRTRLTDVGALIAAAMLAFSPTMMYFSRFARNDILVALLTLALVICIWRYMDDGRKKYLYYSSALLALLFTAKETAYIITAIFGFYFFLLVSFENFHTVKKFAFSNKPNVITVAYKFILALCIKFYRGVIAKNKSRSLDLIMIFICLSLPLWTAIFGLIQFTPILNWSGLVLISPVGGNNPIGSPYAGGLVIATGFILFTIWIASRLGILWNKKIWWRCALLFSFIWILCFSSFLTNLGGIGSCIWSSLGYWLVQQEEARGGQPWYYYLILINLYELLPILISVPATVFFLKRRDKFDIFLVYWSIATLLAYTIASEKMPWLLVNIILPVIILSARYMGHLVGTIKFNQLYSIKIASYALLPFSLITFLLAIIFYGNLATTYKLAGLFVLSFSFILLAATTAVIIKNKLELKFFKFGFILITIILFTFSIYNSLRVSFKYQDTPVEMMIYTQTSPDITKLVRFIDGFEESNGKGSVSLGVDSTSGFTWPWSWYMRNNRNTRYIPYTVSNLEAISDSDIILVHSRNKNEADELLKGTFYQGALIKHRWWFPEGYRGMSLHKFVDSTVSIDTWRWILRYFLFRDGVIERLGSENAYVYFSLERFPELQYGLIE